MKGSNFFGAAALVVAAIAVAALSLWPDPEPEPLVFLEPNVIDLDIPGDAIMQINDNFEPVWVLLPVTDPPATPEPPTLEQYARDEIVYHDMNAWKVARVHVNEPHLAAPPAWVK